MRRIVMFNRITVEGFFADEDGSLAWVVPEPALDAAAASGLQESDMILFGRRTYEMFASFWPNAGDDGKTAANPHDGGRSKEMHAVAAWMNATPKWVFSRTLTKPSWANTTRIPELDAAAISALKEQPGKDIMLFGSGTIVSQLTELGLIDEYNFVISPTLLGNGRSLFANMTIGVSLDLVESKAFPSGNVLLRYQPTR